MSYVLFCVFIGSAWTTDDDDDALYDPPSPTIDDLGSPVSPGTPQLYYTTPPKQVGTKLLGHFTWQLTEI